MVRCSRAIQWACVAACARALVPTTPAVAAFGRRGLLSRRAEGDDTLEIDARSGSNFDVDAFKRAVEKAGAEGLFPEAGEDFDVGKFRDAKADIFGGENAGPIADPSIAEDMDISHYLGGSQFDPYGASSPPGKSKKLEGGAKAYVWQQTEETMSVAIPVPAGTGAKDIDVSWPSRSSVRAAAGGAVLVEGDLRGAVDRDETFWSLEEEAVDGKTVLVLDVAKAGGSKTLWPGFTAAENDPHRAKVTRECYFDVSISDGEPRRVVLGVFGEDVPLTAANFVQLCAGVDVNGKEYSYANSTFHRILPGFMVQGGDVTAGDGTGGISVYGGGAFDDEAFPFGHAGAGVLSMANAGPNSNKSQFFITLNDAEWLDEKHVVFGRVLEGLDVIRDVGKLDTTFMSQYATIVASGTL